MPDGIQAIDATVQPQFDIELHGDLSKLFGALAKAQGEMKNAAKESENPHFKSRYADLANVLDAGRKPLADNGLSLIQIPHNTGQMVALTSILGHSSGAWIKGTAKVKPGKDDAQGMGSVITYLRRYCFSAMVGIAQEDDDGNGAKIEGNGRVETKPTNGAANGKNGLHRDPPAVTTPGTTPAELAPPARDGKADWITFGTSLVAAFRASKNAVILKEWWDKNALAIAEIQEVAPAVYQRVEDNYVGRMNELKEAALAEPGTQLSGG